MSDGERQLRLCWRGRLPYAQALAEQRAWREGVIAGTRGPVLWLLEHDPVVTVGRRAVDVDRARVRDAGYAFFATERGGLATVHEPGQLVGYLIADLSVPGVRRTVGALEGGLIAWCRDRGLDARRRAGFPGVWVGTSKIAAIGLHVSRGVSLHGFALNLRNDLRGFSLIVPCGIADGGVATVAGLRGAGPLPEQAARSVGLAVARELAAAGLGSATHLDTSECGE